MKKTTIDAVQMKRDIQEKIMKEDEGLTDAERREKRTRWLETGEDSLAKFWRRAKAATEKRSNS